MMNTFSVKFTAGSLELDVLVTVSDHYQKYKVEMITGEPNPSLLSRSATGTWTIDKPGSRALTAEQFQELQKAIDKHLFRQHSASKILVLIDFSVSSVNAAKYAASLSHQLHSTHLIIYHSYNYLPVITTTIAPLSPEMIHSVEENEKKLEDLEIYLSKLVSTSTTIEIITDARPLSTAVNTITEQQQVGLIVMGITGKNAVERALVGSNTITISRESKTALLVVPNNVHFKAIEHVVLACDLKDVSKSIPTYAINSFVKALDASLSILYVNKAENETAPDAAKELAELHQIWDQQQATYHYADHDDIEQGIIEFADEHAADLLIAIPKDYGFLQNLFHRSLTKNLAFRSHIPLLIFKGLH